MKRRRSNIVNLARNGYISSGILNAFNNLTYTYGNSSNPDWPTTIADGSGSALGYPNTSGTFSFDAAGNQTTYSAKSITAITYNHLNLPTKYTWSGGNTLEIQYDASGRKLKKIPSTGNAKTYIGGIEYSASVIEAIYHPEGRARLISSTWEYKYAIKDHLGNARVYFKCNGSITFLEESHYYPFGLEQGGWTAPTSPENKYKYNGKEMNDEFSLGLYDYGARWYDPTVGRWGQVDPSSENDRSISPYLYAFNNPLHFTDPDGKWPYPGVMPLFKSISNFFKGSDAGLNQQYSLYKMNGRTSGGDTKLGIQDNALGRLKNGKNVGAPVVRFDAADTKTPFHM
ncbi:MAG TPA: RHS repeat-associated core domain-containing protein [Saprospiraceae bacterium]|nr:RHS repeat-associated core domain-containing protein [Saprospiraceae bacterium]